MTMTLEKFYYDPAHYAGYFMDNLARAAKPDFSRNEVVRWLELQDPYMLHRSSCRKFP